MSIFDPDILEVFIEESKEHLDTLEPDLLLLEKNPEDTETINRIFRAVHSIKGTSGFFGLTRIGDLGHYMESLMSLIRDQKLTANKQMLDALLKGTDKLREMVENPALSGEIDISKEMASLRPFIAEEGNEKDNISINQKSAESIGLPTILEDFNIVIKSFKESLELKQNVYVLKLYTQKDIAQQKLTPLGILSTIESLGTLLDSKVDYAEIDGLNEDSLNKDISLCLLFSTIMQPDLIAGSFGIKHEQIEEISTEIIEKISQLTEDINPQEDCVEIAPKPSEKSNEVLADANNESTEKLEDNLKTEDETTQGFSLKTINPEPTSEEIKAVDEMINSEGTPRKGEETIRVSIALLDDLMNLAGEMVLARNRLLRLGNKANSIAGIGSVVQNISLITSDLQEKVMHTRLQPIGSILGKFNRVVRDLGSKLNKEIHLDIEGEEVELDKSILESLSDPLNHIIRNCADHAIEPPEERLEKSKTRQGNIKISARHVGGQVHIIIKDDGRGIHPHQIREIAVKKGIIRHDKAQKLTDRQATLLIFKPGFSCTQKVSDVSGRGVGMDVVKTNIEKVGGNVELESIYGKGTTICLRLPLTLAIVPAMTIESGGQRYAVPQENLEEIVGLNQNRKVEWVRNTKVLRLRENLLPLVRLSDVLESDKLEENQESKVTSHSKSFDGYILVLRIGENLFGLIVDKILEIEEIVVKPLSSYLKSNNCYSGATIMGDGQVAMIIDTAGIAQIANLDFQIKDEIIEDKDKDSDITEVQSVLLFKNGSQEQFAMELQMISRIEKVNTSDIEKFGDKEYINYQDSSLLLTRLEDNMPVSKPIIDKDYLYIIVPNLVSTPIGIIATDVVDTIKCKKSLERKSIIGTGIMGTSVIDDKLTVFLNTYDLFEAAAPELYPKLNTEEVKDKRILLAEDTSFFRTVVSQYLSEFTDEVDIAVNGQEALEMIQKTPYDLLVTDIEMPIINGLDLVRQVRQDPQRKDTPIVALTSHSSEYDVSEGYAAGVDHYEIKLDKDTLNETIRGVFKGTIKSKRTDLKIFQTI